MTTQSITPIAEQLRKICTYHGDEGTSGYCISNEQFAKIEKLIAESISRERERNFSLFDEILETAWQDRESAEDPNDPRARVIFLKQELKRYKDLLTKESK